MYPAESIVPTLAQNLPGGTFLGTGYGNKLTYLVRTDLDWQVTAIYQFPSQPSQGLPDDAASALLASDGNYYGVLIPLSGPAYVYKVPPAGGDLPFPQSTAGNFYGAVGNGGANHTGVIYRLTLSGQYTELYSFTAGPNRYPGTLIEGSDGNLYGPRILAAIQVLCFE
ncbi:MAG TPA: choice-of-anchor tandem repeat GloVer-containing protein [Bryobacteraceae bacterium]|jgi:uncharacterized repeat protein (TIGR03803 family)|nr:choice-of-anchor tandem repeat GloVer-containing protein [Bryobacteraceae bacterium]